MTVDSNPVKYTPARPGLSGGGRVAMMPVTKLGDLSLARGSADAAG